MLRLEPKNYSTHHGPALVHGLVRAGRSRTENIRTNKIKPQSYIEGPQNKPGSLTGRDGRPEPHDAEACASFPTMDGVTGD